MRYPAGLSSKNTATRAALASLAALTLGAAVASCSSESPTSAGSGGGANPSSGAAGHLVASGAGGSMSGGSSAAGGSLTQGGTAAEQGGNTSAGSNTSGGSVSTAGGAGSSSGGASSAGANNAGASNGGASSGGSSGAGASGAGSSGASGSGGAAAGAGGGTHAGKWKVMMLGDSITASTCYPQFVHRGFVSQGKTNFEFIGSQRNGQACGAMPVAEEGHGGYGVTYLPQNSTRGACTKPSGCGSYAELATWAALKPEIVLMHYGTNDLWDGQSPAAILSAYESVIAEFRKQNPSVIFFVSKVIKLNPWSGNPSSTTCAPCPGRVTALTSALTDTWAQMNSTATSRVWLIDNYSSGFDPNDPTDTGDGVHPTPAGALKSANATVAAVVAKNYL